jgi:hypothetical protein
MGRKLANISVSMARSVSTANEGTVCESMPFVVRFVVMRR